MPRSHIHGLDAVLATDTVGHHSLQSVLGVDFCIASIIIRSSTCTSLTMFERVKNLTTDKTTIAHP